MEWRARLALILLMWAPATALGVGPTAKADAVLARWAATLNGNDADALVRMYAPDAIFLGTTSPIIAEGTTAIRAYFSGLPGSGNSVVLGDHRVIPIDDGAALVTGFYDFTIIRAGKPMPVPARFTMLVVAHDGVWQIVHHHSSARPNAP